MTFNAEVVLKLRLFKKTLHLHARQHKAAQAQRLFDPQHHAVTRATGVVTQIVVQADLGHLTALNANCRQLSLLGGTGSSGGPLPSVR